MPIERLEINRFSETGELARRVSCVAGRVTVFRANSQELLTAYEDALCGRRTKERFEITVDSTPFRPADHVFVGFGEQLPSEAGLTVRTYLETKRGSAAQQATSRGLELLERAGAGAILDRRLRALSAAEQHLIKLIAGIIDPARLLVLSDPFLPLDPSTAEQLATMITGFAWREQGLVVVTQMSGRPETWIENPHIVRTQLERPRQATIGFGADGATELVDRLRKGLLQPEQRAADADAGLAPEARPAPMTRDPRADLVRRGVVKEAEGTAAPKVIATLTALVHRGAELLRADRRAQIGSGIAVLLLALMLQRPDGNPPARPLPAVPAPPPSSRPAPELVEVERPTIVSPEPRRGVDAYPEPVRQALLLSFSDPGKALAQQKVSFPKAVAVETIAPPPRAVAAPVREEAPPAVEPPPPGPPPFALPQGVGNAADRPALTPEELEQRRQYIRQALLDAIQRRSQQMYGTPVYDQGQ